MSHWLNKWLWQMDDWWQLHVFSIFFKYKSFFLSHDDNLRRNANLDGLESL